MLLPALAASGSRKCGFLLLSGSEHQPWLLSGDGQDSTQRTPCPARLLGKGQMAAGGRCDSRVSQIRTKQWCHLRLPWLQGCHTPSDPGKTAVQAGGKSPGQGEEGGEERRRQKSSRSEQVTTTPGPAGVTAKTFPLSEKPAHPVQPGKELPGLHWPSRTRATAPSALLRGPAGPSWQETSQQPS